MIPLESDPPGPVFESIGSSDARVATTLPNLLATLVQLVGSPHFYTLSLEDRYAESEYLRDGTFLLPSDRIITPLSNRFRCETLESSGRRSLVGRPRLLSGQLILAKLNPM